MVKNGLDNIHTYRKLLEGKRLGLITNPSGIDSSFRSSIDLLHDSYDLRVLFGPEHGIRGDMQAGAHVDGYTDAKTGLHVHSLYGSNSAPTAGMLEDIDLLVIDLQDVGARFYTYMYTMVLAMQACAAAGKQVAVVDRVNPLGGAVFEGNMTEPAYKSFIGYPPLVQRHGLTMGELAGLFNAEHNIGCDLTVLRLTDWRRDMYFNETSQRWVLPSPNIPTPETCLLFAANCIFENTNVSEGRGTTRPFHLVGAPYINGERLAARMNEITDPNAVRFRPHSFMPTFSKHQGEVCGGVETHVIDRDLFRPVRTGLLLLYTIREMFGGFAFSGNSLSTNMGMDMVLGGADIFAVYERFESDERKYAPIWNRYLLY